MTPVTIASGSRSSYYSTGSVGWSAHSAFSYHTTAQLIAAPSLSLPFGRLSSTTALGQSFVTSAQGGHIASVRLHMSRASVPTDNLRVHIHTEDAGRPSSTILGTSRNIDPTVISTAMGWVEFLFDSPILVSGNTKYWIVVERTGSLHTTQYYSLQYSSSNEYPSGGMSTFNGTSWSSEDASNDALFQVLYEEPFALYHVTQDSKLHVWRSTDYGVTWSEQDSTGAPTSSSAVRAFDADDSTAGPWIATARSTGTTTAAVRLFDMSTNTWQSSDFGTSPPNTVYFDRPIRVTMPNVGGTATEPGAIYLHFTTTTDTADIVFQRCTSISGSWGSKTNVLAATSTSDSTISDVVIDRTKPGNVFTFYSNVALSSFAFRSVSSLTQSTIVDADATAATSVSQHPLATYQPYHGVNDDATVIAAYINSNDQLNERIIRMGVPSAQASMSGGNVVSTNTGAAGRTITTCRYDTTNYVIFSDSSTSIVYTTSTTPGTWDTDVTWKTGLSSASVTEVISIPSVGVLVFYTDDGNAKSDWLVGPSIPPTLISVGDTSTLASSESLEAGTSIANADTGTVSEGSDVTIGATVSAVDTDTIMASESLTVLTTKAVNLADIATLTSTRTLQSSSSLTRSDSAALTATELFNAITTTSISLSDADTLTASEAQQRAATLPLTDSDTFTAAESFTVVTTASVSLSDTTIISATDTVSIMTTEAVSLTDSDTLTAVEDKLITGTIALTDTDTDTLTLTESLEPVSTIYATDSGVVSSVDTSLVTSSILPTDADTLTATELVDVLTTDYVVVSDTTTLTVTDTLAIVTITDIALTDTDTVTVVDQIALSTTRSLTDSSTLAASESFTDDTSIFVVVSDSGTISESGTVVVNTTVYVSDSDTLTGADTIDTGTTDTLSTNDIGSINSTEVSAVFSTSALQITETVSGIGELATVAQGALDDQDTLSALEAFTTVVTQTITDSGAFTAVESSITDAAMGVEDQDTITVVETTERTDSVIISESVSLVVSDLFEITASEQVHNVSDSVTITTVESLMIETTVALSDSGQVSAAETFIVASEVGWSDSGVFTETGDFFAYIPATTSDTIGGMAQQSPVPTTPIMASVSHVIDIVLAKTTFDPGLVLTRTETDTPITASYTHSPDPVSSTKTESIDPLALSKVTGDIV